MRLVHKLVVFLGLAFFWASPTFGATITGNVTGPDGKPLMGVFVVAENAQSKMTVTVLSDAQGHYHISTCRPPPIRCKSRPSATRAIPTTTSS